MYTDDLREEYGERVTRYSWRVGDDLWTDDYVMWLEKQLLIQRVSQRSEPLPLFDDRHLNNGISFTLTESGKLGNHPESKLVYDTTAKLKKWILDNFELKKR